MDLKIKPMKDKLISDREKAARKLLIKDRKEQHLKSQKLCDFKRTTP